MRRLIRKLHTFSISVWDRRNQLLYGDTLDKRRTIRSALIREKVNESFDLYMEGKLNVLGRDNYLFTRKPRELRLAGDDDTLLGWLGAVEAAMKTYERQQDKETKNASKFFQQFRALGRQKILVNRVISGVTTQEEEVNSAIVKGNSFSTGINHRIRETEQLVNDVSPRTQVQYRGRRQQMALDGLSDTILGDYFDDAERLAYSSSDESARKIVDLGP